MMGAGAIAVTPVAHNAAETQQAQTRAYELTAAMDATASPLEVYGAFAENTVGNLIGLGGALLADPAPLLRQVLENQAGYAETTIAAFTGIPAAIENWYNGDNGKVLLDEAQAKLLAGDIAGAYEDFNRSLLYGLGTGLTNPLRAPGFILSGIPRGGSEYIAGIPEQIAQNVANLVAAGLSTGNASAVFEGVFAPISGSVFELSRIGEAIGTSLTAGEFDKVVNALVNTPGILANAVLNGFDYGDDTSEWAGLIRYVDHDAEHEGKVVNGLVQSLLINIPKALAGAIDNTPEPAEEAATTRVLTPAPQQVSSTPSLSRLSAVIDVEPATPKAATALAAPAEEDADEAEQKAKPSLVSRIKATVAPAGKSDKAATTDKAGSVKSKATGSNSSKSTSTKSSKSKAGKTKKAKKSAGSDD